MDVPVLLARWPIRTLGDGDWCRRAVGLQSRAGEPHMPLRDHFRPPVSKRSSWEGFHAAWPMEMVRQLAPQLPDCLVAEPRVHLGTFSEISPTPTPGVEINLPEQYAYEVLIFDLDRDRTLVAAIEIVSPANKDRPGHRQLFVAKCANLLQKGVCVSIVDLVTIRRFNLYAELLAVLGQSDPTFGDDPPLTYAVTCRKREVGGKTRLETWAFPLAVGQPLPSLPVWLADDLAVRLDLETSYEEACRVLKIR